jgi:predicted transcriptional regulator YheO
MTQKAVLKTHRRAHREYLAGDAPQVQSAQTSKVKTSAAKERSTMPDQGLKQTDLVAFNQNAEQVFVSLLKELIQSENGIISYREAVRETAFELNVSIDTAKRYLEKHSARRAEFSIADGSVRLREINHVNPR